MRKCCFGGKFMGKALIFIILGIGIIVYNHMSADSVLVLRGTKLDFGYIAIGYGLIVGVMAMVRKKDAPAAATSESAGDDGQG
jgi:hypothetical protein